LMKINKSIINESIIKQLIKSATSVGANYCEANGATSRKDFKNKIHICRKEIQETRYWLELIAQTNKEEIKNLRRLWQEAHEFHLIFQKVTSTIDKKV